MHCGESGYINSSGTTSPIEDLGELFVPILSTQLVLVKITSNGNPIKEYVVRFLKTRRFEIVPGTKLGLKSVNRFFCETNLTNNLSQITSREGKNHEVL